MRRNLGFALVVLLVAAATVLVVTYLGREPREAPGTHPAPAETGGAQAEHGAPADVGAPSAGSDAGAADEAGANRLVPTFSADAAVHDRAKQLMAVYAEYEPRTVLITFAEGTTPEEANALLAQAEAIAPTEVTQADLDHGLVMLSVADGRVVEDAVVELADSDVVDVAQPNYVYRINDESVAEKNLVARLAQGNPAYDFVRPAATASPAEELFAAAADEQEVAVNDFGEWTGSEYTDRTWHLTDVNAFKAWWYLRDATGVPSNNARVAIFDVLEITDDMRQIIAAEVDLDKKSKALRQAAFKSGQRGYLVDGARLIKEGVTSYEELVRVLSGKR